METFAGINLARGLRGNAVGRKVRQLRRRSVSNTFSMECDSDVRTFTGLAARPCLFLEDGNCTVEMQPQRAGCVRKITRPTWLLVVSRSNSECSQTSVSRSAGCFALFPARDTLYSLLYTFLLICRPRLVFRVSCFVALLSMALRSLCELRGDNLSEIFQKSKKFMLSL